MKNKAEYQSSKDIELYIHVPYCVRKCAYCDFYSLSDRESESEYLHALLSQLSLFANMAKRRNVRSVYIGGGTPSLLQTESFQSIFSFIFEHFNINKDAEITCEANPATIDEEKAIALLKMGVNRISIGCQSADNEDLKKLSRLHTFEQFCETFRLLRRCGTDNISVDLMFGLPNQTNEKLQDSIRKISILEPEHISLYMLKIEEGTAFGKCEKSLNLPCEDDVANMYLSSIEQLSKYGYLQYEISNFAKKGKESIHNLGYWKNIEYLGAGPSAASYFDSCRFCCKRDLKAFITCTDFNMQSDIYSENDKLSKEDIRGERIMLSLRLNEGCILTDEESKSAKETINKYEKADYIKKDGDRICLTPRGMLLSNYIISDILLDLGL